MIDYQPVAAALLVREAVAAGGRGGVAVAHLEIGKRAAVDRRVAEKAQVALAEKVRGKGAAFVECPVSGSVIPARAGKLLGLMGAEPADAARARPLLEQRSTPYRG